MLHAMGWGHGRAGQVRRDEDFFKKTDSYAKVELGVEN